MLGEEFKAQYLAEYKKEQDRAYSKKYREANKEKIAAKKKAYSEAHKEKTVAVSKAYREANKEVILAKKKAYHAANREKQNAACAAWYAANKTQESIKSKAKVAERNLMLFNYKGAACQDCGISDPTRLEIYDYHHVDPSTKAYEVSKIIKGPLDKLMIEVDKCVLLCSNCHKSEHARLRKVSLNE